MNLNRLIASLATAAALLAAPVAYAAESAKGGVQTVQMTLTDEGTQPSVLTAKAGQPLKIVITRKTAASCVTKVVMKELGVDQELPLDKPVTVEVTPAKPGTYRMVCGMGMEFASLKVK